MNYIKNIKSNSHELRYGAGKALHAVTRHSSLVTRHVSRLSGVRANAPALLALLAVGVIFVASLLSMPPEGLTQHDTGAKYLQVRNLRFTPAGLDWSINYPARSLDPQLQFVPFHPKQHTVDGGERIHLQWPIFLGLLTRIPWKVLGFWGLYVVPFLAGLCVLWLTYRLALQIGVPRRIAWLAVPLVGLATPISVYSLLFFEHTLAAALVAGSLLAAVTAMRPHTTAQLSEEHTRPPANMDCPTPEGRYIALSGALLALAVYFRSELYLLALVMAALYTLMAWRRQAWRRALGVWVVAFSLALIPLWGFYAWSEGSLLPLHATWYFAGSNASNGSEVGGGGLELPALRYIARVGWAVIPDFLFGPQTFPLSPSFPLWAEWGELAGAALCTLAALSKLARLRTSWRLATLLSGLTLLLLTTSATLLSTQSYYNLHGFLLASPFVALALWPGNDEGRRACPELAEGTKDHTESANTQYAIRNTQYTSRITLHASRFTPPSWLFAVTLLYVGLHVLVISAFSGLGPISRHEWGQRYLLPAYPPLVALSLLAAWRIWMQYAPRWKGLALSLLIVWAALTSVGVGFSVRGYVMLRDEREQVVEWGRLAQTLPGKEPLVTDVWWLPLNLAASFYSRPMMLAEGDARLLQWAAQMREKGVRSFGLLTTNPTIFKGEWLRQIEGLRAEGQPQEARGVWLQRFALDDRR